MASRGKSGTSCAAALMLLAGLACGSVAAGAAKKSAVPPQPAGKNSPPIVLDVELLEKAATPTLAQIKPYSEALAVYRYRVLAVVKGELKPTEIGVTHWVIYRNEFQPITRTPLGKRLRLEVRPFEEVRGSVQTVYRGELPRMVDNLYHDVAQQIVMPASERGRGGYGVDLTGLMPLFFKLKDQLKLVVLGDCQGWFANKAELYYGEENRRTPVSLNMGQQRSGLPFQKLLVENYLVHLPKLEWVVLTWNPRFVNANWGEHGIKGKAFASSPGFKYDQERAAEVWKPNGNGQPLTVQDIQANPELAKIWNGRPWGWINLGPSHNSAKAEVLGNQRKLGLYRFVPERWALFESIVKMLADRKVRLLAFTTPVHPETANQPVKDKTGVDAPGYQAQVVKMKELEKQYPEYFFFYDLNNMGNNGLEDSDFGNIDHVSGPGAQKVSERVEKFRLDIVKRLGLDAKSAATTPKG